MSNSLGFGAMLYYLAGGSEQEPSKYYGRKITSAKLDEDDNKFFIAFEDGTTIAIYDNGQSCCESRYMRTDDDLSVLVGGTLRLIETKAAPDAVGELDEVHEVVFLEVCTENAIVTFSNHNEHNGYYGGFGMTIKEVQA